MARKERAMSSVSPRASLSSRSRFAGAIALCAASVLLIPACTMPDRVSTDTHDSQAGWPGIVPVEDSQNMLGRDPSTQSLSLSWKIGDE